MNKLLSAANNRPDQTGGEFLYRRLSFSPNGQTCQRNDDDDEEDDEEEGDDFAADDDDDDGLYKNL
ncbi:hypothetical protein DPMN_064411 [Dreissena polymorpha]|uniref:Uncharacterized protein n=1 Tax=Dreissena polymorpha TaxID=45954 RepID=A0A9D4CDJ4_DREPO|nr:hypothetical protein DPMN_064411 [Dreissena polymorpha]